MTAQFLIGFVVAVIAMGWVTAESFVRSARRRDAVRQAQARRGVRPALPHQAAGPDEKPEERHDPRPVGAR